MKGQTISGFKLSPQQKYLWLLQQDSSAYLTQFSLLIEGALQPKILKAALQQVINRHGILRTIFHRLSGRKTPVMVIKDSIYPLWRNIDLSDWDERQKLTKLEEIFQEERRQEFDFEQGPLLHCHLLKLSPNKHLFLIGLPALCADSWTIKNLVKEISISYSDYLGREELRHEEIMQYLQVSEWQNQLLEDEETEAANGYWRQQKLSNRDGLELPFENQPLKSSGFNPECIKEAISPEVTAKITTLAQKYDTSSQVVLLACWQILIWRLTGEPDIVIGRKSDRRDYEELQDVLGLFAVWLPIKSHLSPDLRFFEVLEHSQTTITDAEEWQDYFVPEPVNNGEGLAFPVGFEFEQLPEKQFAAGVSFSLYQQYSCIESFKVKLTCTQCNGLLEAEFHYDVDYFSIETVQHLAKQFQILLASAAENPDVAISQLEILSQSDRQQLLFEFNQTQIDYSKDNCIHQLFEEKMKRTPDNIAVVFEDQQLTYAQLNVRANQLAHYLQHLGVKPEVLVGVYLERSLEVVISILGILKAGGAYLPLDPALPTAGLDFRLQDAQIKVLLTLKKLVKNLPEPIAKVVCLDSDWEVISSGISENPRSGVTPENLVYTIYTSGSTGEPKGVAVEHQQLLNYIHAIREKLNLSVCNSYATFSTFAADLGNTAIFPALCTGGCLHVVSQEQVSDPEALVKYFRRYPIDCLKIVPSHLAALLTYSGMQSILPRQRLILGGEAASWSLIEQIQQQTPNCQIINHYGPTETTVGVLTYSVNGQINSHVSQTVPLGRPLANTQVYVLDKQLHPLPIGVPGELYIGGAGLARGYLNRSELTAERFITNPFTDDPKARLYKTGDLARHLLDGNLEFLGRTDNQVKIRGFRIELGEIEALLNQYPGVHQSVVSVWEEQGSKRLVAYIVPNKQQRPSVSDLRRFLGEKQPEYMAPGSFVFLKALPLMANGKVDRQSLPAPNQARPELAETFVAPRNEAEKKLAAIWQEMLQVEKVGANDNFFELGGHSLLVVQVHSKIKGTFNRDVLITDLFKYPTIGSLANYLGEGQSKQSSLEKVQERAEERLSSRRKRSQIRQRTQATDKP